MEFHVEGLVENGEDVPEWLKNGDYEFVYNYQDATTLLKAYSPYVSLAAISRASWNKPKSFITLCEWIEETT